jgi:hypothetical protein
MAHYLPGQSGNPLGRNGSTVGTVLTKKKTRELINKMDVIQILKMVVDKAKDGDMDAARIILDRTIPKLKSVSNSPLEPTVAELGGVFDSSGNGVTPASINALAAQITTMAASGDINIDTAINMMQLLKTQSEVFANSGDGRNRITGTIPTV